MERKLFAVKQIMLFIWQCKYFTIFTACILLYLLFCIFTGSAVEFTQVKSCALAQKKEIKPSDQNTWIFFRLLSLTNSTMCLTWMSLGLKPWVLALDKKKKQMGYLMFSFFFFSLSLGPFLISVPPSGRAYFHVASPASHTRRLSTNTMELLFPGVFTSYIIKT